MAALECEFEEVLGDQQHFLVNWILICIICTIHHYTTNTHSILIIPFKKVVKHHEAHSHEKNTFLPCFLPIFPSLPMFAQCHCAATVIGVVGQSPTRRRRAAGECPGLGCLQLWRTATDSEGRTDHVRRALVRVGGWMDKRGILKGFKGIDPPFFLLDYVICHYHSLSGLWFGTMEFYDFPFSWDQLGMSSSQLTKSIIFQRGGEKPPTTYSW